MQIRISEDKVEIRGYVNAIERKSKPLSTRIGKFVERINKGAFKRAIERNGDIRLLLNHDWTCNLGGTKDGTLELVEDNIGLRAKAIITNADVIQKARRGELVGWSFGFTDRDVDSHDENGILTRDVKDLNLYEVSILDRTRTPAYDGNIITVRDQNEMCFYGEEVISEIETRDDTIKSHNIDYSEYENMIAKMKGEENE